METLPIYSIDLISTLDSLYPESSPNPEDSERELWMKAGERRLVRVLVSKAKQIEDNQLENSYV
jgi:hypothetical protein